LKCKYSKLSLLMAQAFDLSGYLCQNV